MFLWLATGSLLAFLFVLHRRSQLLPAKGKIVFVSGCDSGFGYMTALKLADMGALVKESLTKLKLKNIRAVPLDITSTVSIQHAYEESKKICGNQGLWALINNAGIVGSTTMEMTSMDTYQNVMAVNFLGHVEMTKTFLPLLKKSKGRLINMASIVGYFTGSYMACYGASKAAMVSWTNAIRNELRPYGITTICIAPGFMNTPLLNEERLGEILQNGWHSVSEEERSTIDKEKHEKEANFVLQFTKLMKENPSKVRDAYINACLSVMPKNHYIVGITGVLLYILGLLPAWISDFTWTLSYYATNF